MSVKLIVNGDDIFMYYLCTELVAQSSIQY